MAGEQVHEQIEAHRRKHILTYAEAMREVMSDEDAGAEVKAYARGEPGELEQVAALEGELQKLAGEHLDRLARAHMKRQGERDYRVAFDAACRQDPTTARQYGVVERPAARPWWA